jgi:hypothetical protein
MILKQPHRARSQGLAATGSSPCPFYFHETAPRKFWLPSSPSRTIFGSRTVREEGATVPQNSGGGALTMYD